MGNESREAFVQRITGLAVLDAATTHRGLDESLALRGYLGTEEGLVYQPAFLWARAEVEARQALDVRTADLDPERLGVEGSYLNHLRVAFERIGFDYLGALGPSDYDEPADQVGPTARLLFGDGDRCLVILAATWLEKS